MLQIDKSDELNQLHQMALHLEADIIEDFNSAKLTFDNLNGSGYITTYQMFYGLTSQTYNIKLTKELRLKKMDTQNVQTYFLYCVKGHYYHRFHGEQEFRKISQNQNVILAGNPKEGHEIVLPAQVDLQLSMLFLSSDKLNQSKGKKARTLEVHLKKLATTLSIEKGHNYFGRIYHGTAQYAKVLIENERVDTVGILMTEGAILNTLASQLANHEESQNVPLVKPLRSEELEKIIALGDFIKSNINRPIGVEELSEKSGLNQKKLQKGSKYLYGESMGSLIQRLRLERARELFVKTELSISEVTYSVGIASRSYFSRIFHREFGLYPSEFKKNIDNTNLIFELSYQSIAAKGLQESDIEDILRASNQNNGEHDITGALVYFKDVFFQIVEGPKTKILQLYEKLLLDQRHHDLKVIYKGIKTQRAFKDWSMAFISDDKGHESKNFEGKLSFIDLEPIMKDMESYEVFSDILWRRVRTILKASA